MVSFLFFILSFSKFRITRKKLISLIYKKNYDHYQIKNLKFKRHILSIILYNRYQTQENAKSNQINKANHLHWMHNKYVLFFLILSIKLKFSVIVVNNLIIFVIEDVLNYIEFVKNNFVLIVFIRVALCNYYSGLFNHFFWIVGSVYAYFFKIVRLGSVKIGEN